MNLNLLSPRTSAVLLSSTLSALTVFHLLIITGTVPYEWVWGGRLNNVADMYTYEGSSLLITLLMLSVVMVYGGLLRVGVNRTLLRIVLWIMVVLFLMSACGNSLSVNESERLFLAPVSLVMGFLSWQLVRQKVGVVEIGDGD